MPSDMNSQIISQDSTENSAALESEKKSKRKTKELTQDKVKKNVYRASYIGVLGGAGYYDVSFDPSYGTVGDISPVFGVSFRYESPVNKSIELELRYRSGGWQSQDIYIRDLGIIELPVIAHVSFGKKKTRPFFTLGETVTFVISEKEETLDPATDPVFSDYPIDNKVGFALNFGLGVIRYFAKSAVQFEVRGTLALTNLYKPGNELLISKSNAFFAEGTIKYLFRVK